jgi:ATP-dependent DNA helicase DinG
MRGELVALDLETTGLDIHNDHIIEVGIVRLRDGTVIDEFSTMVNPPVAIPSITTHITGIQQEDVINAPRIEKVLPQIAQFVGDAPVIAHNISMDMGFMQDRYGILKGNLGLDTYDLASVLLPSAPRYNLNSLTQMFDINLDNAHRALADARATALLYWALWQRLLEMPASLVKTILHLSQNLDWGTRSVFETAYKHSLPETYTSPQSRDAMPVTGQPLSPRQDAQAIDADAITDVLGPQGKLSQHQPEFEPRAQQLDMAHAIRETFNASRHHIIEAGTGTGKSLAYLVTAIQWAVGNDQRVVISTNTITLQDQLLQQDIPLLQSVMETPFRATVMKGRSHYLSPRRLELALRHPPTSLVEMRTLAKILVWQLDNASGDRKNLSLRGNAEYSVWQTVSAEDYSQAERCWDEVEKDTPFCRARRAAESAHIIIVNHALLIADAQSGNQVLPEYDYLIIDEAHQLEDAITNGLSIHVSDGGLIGQLNYLGGVKQGVMSEILNTARSTGTEKERLKLEQFITSLSEATTAMRASINTFFKTAKAFVEDARPNRHQDYVTFLRIEDSHRQSTAFHRLQNSWQNLTQFFTAILEALGRLKRFLNRSKTTEITPYAQFIDQMIQQLDRTQAMLNTLCIDNDGKTVHWLSLGQTDNAPTFHSAPVHVGEMMETYLWNQKQSVILTSATLRTQGEFQFLQQRLHAEDIPALDVGSPFNYKDSTLLYLPTDMPEPNERKSYQQAVERCIVELAAELRGRVMVLFTSYGQLRQTAQVITPRLALGNITVYDQSDGTSRQNLLDGFKTTERAVLLGTRSFWEGVDVPGESLSALIIARLPFAVPTDPVFASRAESYDNPFSQYNLPEAILRFRQGFGRLIRRQSDRGIVVVLDARVRTKGYGPAFINALPECTMREDTLDNLPRSASHWLATD